MSPLKLRDANTTDKAFENTSTSVAASQMRNALNQLADTVKDPAEKQVCLPVHLDLPSEIMILVGT